MQVCCEELEHGEGILEVVIVNSGAYRKSVPKLLSVFNHQRKRETKYGPSLNEENPNSTNATNKNMPGEEANDDAESEVSKDKESQASQDGRHREGHDGRRDYLRHILLSNLPCDF